MNRDWTFTLRLWVTMALVIAVAWFAGMLVGCGIVYLIMSCYEKLA